MMRQGWLEKTASRVAPCWREASRAVPRLDQASGGWAPSLECAQASVDDDRAGFVGLRLCGGRLSLK